ncbi:MAG: DNA starvation/stationary phase protection protein [Parachlamydia sp.]|nr:DNA starvation/stationary phase protection protein [Parachlamydia sp.]
MVTKEISKSEFGHHIGLDDKRVQEIAGLLNNMLADIHALYLRTLGCHWNMEDPRFYFFHELLENQYKELAEEQDLVAEKLRQIGKKAPATMQEYKQLMSQKESLEPLNADEMIEGLVAIYEQLIRNLRRDVERTTTLEDFGTADILTQILRAFEKRAWLLRSHLLKQQEA